MQQETRLNAHQHLLFLEIEIHDVEAEVKKEPQWEHQPVTTSSNVERITSPSVIRTQTVATDASSEPHRSPSSVSSHCPTNLNYHHDQEDSSYMLLTYTNAATSSTPSQPLNTGQIQPLWSKSSYHAPSTDSHDRLPKRSETFGSQRKTLHTLSEDGRGQTAQGSMGLSWEALQLDHNRLQVENERMQVMKGRLQLEKEILQLEQHRRQLEQECVQAEKDRLQVENLRMQVEKDRIQVEKDRVQLEKDRLRVEEERLQVAAERLHVERDKVQLQKNMLQLEKDELHKNENGAQARNLLNEQIRKQHDTDDSNKK